MRNRSLYTVVKISKRGLVESRRMFVYPISGQIRRLQNSPGFGWTRFSWVWPTMCDSDVSDNVMLGTLLWWQFWDVGGRIIMMVTILIIVSNISNMPPTLSVSNIRHQNRCSPDWDSNSIIPHKLSTAMSTKFLYRAKSAKIPTSHIFMSLVWPRQIEGFFINCLIWCEIFHLWTKFIAQNLLYYREVKIIDKSKPKMHYANK